MKIKILIILGSILLLTGCNTNEEKKDTKNIETKSSKVIESTEKSVKKETNKSIIEVKK